MSTRKVHFANIRLHINAGVMLPECKAYAPLLDMNAGRLAMSGKSSEVTCKRCLNLLAKVRQ